MLLATFGFLHFLKEGGKEITVLIPDLRVDAVAYARPFHCSLDNPRILQLFQMLGSGGLREAGLLHDVATDTGVRFYKMLQYGNPRRVGDCFCHSRQLILLFSE